MHISNKSFHKILGIKGNYGNTLPKKLISAMLMLALLCSSLAIPQEFHLTASADNATYWNDEENNVYKYADFSPFTGGTGKPTGEAGNPYLISNAAQLAALAILVNECNNSETKKVSDNNKNEATCSNFQDTFIELTTDIDLGAHEWVPIGLGDLEDNANNPTNVFKGNFDGCGYTISNMHIGTSGTYSTYDYAGLFGYVQADNNKTVTIQNVNIGRDSWVYTSSYSAGGICAYADAPTPDKTDDAKITISNCCNSGSVTAASTESSSYAGGICAVASSYASTTINNCSNSGNITASSSGTDDAYAGGICAQASATINNCSNSGSVKATSTSGTVCAGGICAQATDGATISNCYYLDGCVGTTDENGIFEPSNPQRGIGNKSDQTGTTTALPEKQMTAAADETEGSGWKDISVNNQNKGKIALVDALNAWVYKHNSNNPDIEALYWEVKETDNYPTFLNTWSAKVTLDSKEIYCYADFSPFAAGNNKGKSYDAPYEIGSPAQLAALAILVNNTGTGTDSVKDINNSSATCSNFQGKYIKLTTDIDLGAHEWVPIGLGGGNPFKGNFDGDNKTISNMHIGTSGTYSTYEYAGLFGYVKADSDVTIQNVNIGENSWVYIKNDSDDAYAGGICAFAYAADDGNAKITISNCSNSANITAFANAYANAFAGGICAFAEADDGTITISNCCNSANITAASYYFSYAGGICAVTVTADAAADDDDDGTITISNCCNSANITAFANAYANAFAGGICAFAEASGTITISNCSNSANITAFAKAAAAGGICAKAHACASGTITISNCCNSANITADSDSDSYAGGICADADADDDGTITISNCCNSANITASDADAYANAYAGGICAEANANANADATITISNCYYLNSSTNNGVGITTGSVTQTTTALPAEQMKAAADKNSGFVGIVVGDYKYYSLVNALNAWVGENNSENKYLYWELDDGEDGSGYPVPRLEKAGEQSWLENRDEIIAKVENKSAEADKEKNKGYITVTPMDLIQGETITGTVVANEGYKLSNLKYSYKNSSGTQTEEDKTNNVKNNKFSLITPGDISKANNTISFTATFEKINYDTSYETPVTHPVTYKVTNLVPKADKAKNKGYITLDATEVVAGDVINGTVTVVEGYKVANVSYSYTNSDKKTVTKDLAIEDNAFKLTVPNDVIAEGTISISAKFEKSGEDEEKTDKNAWVKDGDNWTYWKDGKQVTGWFQDGGNDWFYCDPKTGFMKTGWFQDGGNDWFYCDPKTGAMKTGWFKDGGNDWFYCDPKTGAMKTGWFKDGGSTWYYCFTQEDASKRGNRAGAMAANHWVRSNNKWYYLNKQGAMETTKWVKNADDILWSWVGEDGAFLYTE